MGCPYFSRCQNKAEKDDDGEKYYPGCTDWWYRAFFPLPFYKRCKLYKKYKLEQSKTI
jgi:hypothetical protein